MKKFFRGLRFKLIVLVLIGIIPAMGLSVWKAYQGANQVRREAERELMARVQEIQRRSEILFVTTRQHLITLSILPQTKPDLERHCSFLATSQQQRLPWVTSVGIADRNGRVVCHTTWKAGEISVADRDWFKEVVAKKGFTVSKYLVGRLTGKPIVSLSYPILHEDEVVGVVFAGVDLEWLGMHLQPQGFPEEWGSTVTLFTDAQGTVLSRWPEGEKVTGHRVEERGLLAVIKGEDREGLVEAYGVDGVKRLYAHSVLYPADGPTGVHVFVGVEPSRLYAGVVKEVVTDLGTLAFVALVGLLAAWFGGELFLLKQVRALGSAAEKMSEGDLQARTSLSYGSGEMGALAQAFDHMADSLGRRDRELRNALLDSREKQESLNHLLEVSPVVIYRLEPQSLRHVWVSPNVKELLGYPAEEILEADWWIKHVHPKDRGQAAASRTRVLAEKHVVQEYRLLGRNGRSLWIRDESRLLTMPDGEPMEVIGAWVDITQKKLAEEKILEQLQILESLCLGAQKLTENLDEEAMALEAVKNCVESFQVNFALLARAMPDGTAKVISCFPQDHPYAARMTAPWNEIPERKSPTAKAIDTGLVQVCQNILEGPEYAAWSEIAQEYSFKAIASFPMKIRESTLGALSVYSVAPGFFTSERLEAFQAVASQAAAALENARLFVMTRKRMERLEALRNIDMAITGTLDPRVTLRVLLDEVTSKLEVDAADVLLLNPHSQALEYAEGRGFRGSAITKTRLRLGEDYAGAAALERRVIFVRDLTKAQEFVRKEMLREEGFVSFYCAPMIAKGRCVGVLETFHRSPKEEQEEWVGFLKALTAQAAIAVDNAEMFNSLQRSHAQLRQAYDATIEGWSRAMDLKDKETEGHTQRVTELTVRIAKTMGIGEAELVDVRRGALLHDMGKMGIPDQILLKSGPLDPQEWEIMRRHPQYAFEMLSPIEYLRPALDIPYCHHEKWDGSGYPRGLKGKQIPFPARIFAVVDVWDALTSDRPYRAAWSREKALEHIKQGSSTHFDLKVVEAFLREVGA